MPQYFKQHMFTTADLMKRWDMERHEIKHLVHSGILTPCPGSEKKWRFSHWEVGRYERAPGYVMLNDEHAVDTVAERVASILENRLTKTV